MRVLVLNPGSSSLKSSVVESSDGLAARPDPADPMASVHARPTVKAAPPPIAQADIDWGVDATADSDPADDFRRLLGRIEAEGAAADSLGAVGYRVVHGGSRFRQAVLVTPKVIEEIDELRSLAPLHNGVAVATMKAGLAALPRLPHVAVFDTAFHATLPEDAYRYAVPERWYRDWGVRRYGFHGMSVEWSVERTAQLLASPVATLRLVVAHLGSGCSVTATDGGQSAATSMGMTPLEGLMMGTRSGSIDPGIFFYLLRNHRLDGDELEDQLDHHSGLLGVSGLTSDIRELLAKEASGDERAALALQMFVRRAAECIAAAATSLPVLDGIVFTGGIGEHAAGIRSRIVARLTSIGVEPIADLPTLSDTVISSRGSSPAVLRIEAREDLVVAGAVAQLVVVGRSRD